MIEIGRAIDGISINGHEWLLDENNNAIRFESVGEAQEFLRSSGYDEYSDEDLEDNFFFKES